MKNKLILKVALMAEKNSKIMNYADVQGASEELEGSYFS